MKQLFITILRLYDYRIVTGFLAIFLICNIRYFQFIPDICDLERIESPESVLITFWSVIVGSSSIILTILLVVYGSFSKKIKRNSLDFILDNPWIKIVFSLFVSSFIYVSLSFIAIQTFKYATITLLYTSGIITISNIIIQFPLILLSLKYSNSHERIRRLIRDIDTNDINNLFFPSQNTNGTELIEHLEQNKIVLLKDIGVYAIKENDWGLPQNILNELYDKFIKPINKISTNDDLRNSLTAFCFVCNHFKTPAIAESDYITTNVSLHLLVKAHSHLAKNEIRKLRSNPVDNCLKDFHRLIIENKDFYNIQQYLIRDIIKIIKVQFESIKYTDDELPTIDYNLDNRKEGMQRVEKSEELNDYWFYVTHELPDLLFDDLVHAIEVGNKNVYSYFNWQLHSLFDIIYNSKNLTEYQMDDVFDYYLYRASNLCDLAMDKGIYDHIDIISNIQIENWLIKNRKKAFRALYSLSGLIRKLNDKQRLTEYYIDELFIIARRLSGKKMDSEVKRNAIRNILETGSSIYNSKQTSTEIKVEMVKQFKWLNGYLKEDEDLLDLKNDYCDDIDKL